jgi:translocation and assembly module TamB
MRLRDVTAFGERFTSGEADLEYTWHDREQGIAGADVDIRSFVLNKANVGGTALGTVLGAASIRRGGALDAHVVVDGIPLSRVDALGERRKIVDGSVAAVVQVTGNLNDFKDGAGFVAQAEIEVSPVRVSGVPFGDSHLHLMMTQRSPKAARMIRRTGCGNPIGPPFEKQAYLADNSSQGEFVVSGDLFGRTVHLTDVSMTRQKSPVVTGRASLQNLDLGAVSRALLAPSGNDAEGPSATPLSGQLSGNLDVERLPIGDLRQAKLRFDLKPSVIARGAQRLSILQPKEPIVVRDDVLTVPSVELRLESGQAFNGGLKVSGTVTSLTHAPEMNLQAVLDPIDLGVLTRLFPRIERASGRVEGRLSVTGRPSDPKVAGEIHAKADEISARGLPSGFSDVKLDVFANATEIAASGSGRFAGGTLFVNGSAPIRGLSIGNMEATISAHGMRLTPSDGIAATFDADLSLELDAQRQEGGGVNANGGRNLPRVSGEVTVTSFEYTRGITLDLATLGGRARRTVVESYDPSLDNIRLDGIRVRAKAPFKIRNNLVEVQLGIDSGELVVTGSDQRVGLRGALKTLPGGRFHFRSNDFDIQQGTIRFEDPTRIAPNVDVLAVTEYRRFTDSSAASRGAGASAGASLSSGVGTGTGGGAMWRISLHAYGDTDNLKLDMTSEPRLSQEDIVLLLTMGMTRAELDQLQTGSVGASIALTALGTATGADRAVKEVIPVIDDFRFGSGTTRTGKTDPQVTVGKRLTDSLRATVTTGLSEDRELRSNIEWRLTQKLSLQGSYDNINDVSSSAVGNVGVDLRWRLEFE